MGPTYEFCRLIGSLVDESLEGLLHGVDEALIAGEAGVHYVVHFVLVVQELLHHILVLLWRPYNLPSERLEENHNNSWEGFLSS